MKHSHLKTPRTLAECQWTEGYPIATPTAVESVASYLLAFALGVAGAVLLVAWWST